MTSASVSPSCSAQNAMPSAETKPSSACTRCSSGISAERGFGYRPMISAASAASRERKSSSCAIYLSTPPITGSMLATDEITSASIPPSASAGRDCRLLNEGSRRWTRYGRVPPSLTTWQASSPRGDSIAAYTWPAGTRKPSVTSLKWWMSASMDWPMMWAMWSGAGPRPSGPSASRAGQPILASSIITGSLAGRWPESRSRHCPMIRIDWSISSIRSRYRP